MLNEQFSNLRYCLGDLAYEINNNGHRASDFLDQLEKAVTLIAKGGNFKWSVYTDDFNVEAMTTTEYGIDALKEMDTLPVGKE